MADITVKVLEEAASIDLCTLDEMKMMLGIATTITTDDEALAMWITQYSDVIATMCNRVFAKEKVTETWRGDAPPYENYRIYLTHYPVADDDLEAVTVSGTLVDPVDYELENRTGKLTLRGCYDPIVVTYTGGYDLPDEAPEALKQALALLVQAGRTHLARAMTSGIRSISHRESRVMFFDALAGGVKSANSPLAVAGETVDALLYHYMRFNV
ncbi:MAG TPA: hypothetical protein VGQ63_13555 [Pseudolabrys sp.]|jgi:hypothetical protein|nr:hypothetical protein [Pseudolabrys sp.]